MKLTAEEVRHIALLARVGMTNKEIERMQDQMSNILDHFDILQHINTENVDPSGHFADRRTIMRSDTVTQSSPIEDILANTPQQEGGFIKIRAVLE